MSFVKMAAMLCGGGGGGWAYLIIICFRSYCNYTLKEMHTAIQQIDDHIASKIIGL